MTLELVPGSAELLRLATPRPDYIGDDGGRPTWKVLEPSSNEKSKQPIRVSVWDWERTTLDQALAFRGKADCIPLALRCADVHGLAARTGVPTPVVYDPMPGNRASLPGASGHAGIENLDRKSQSGETRPQWQHRLQLLADLLRPVSLEPKLNP